METGNHKAHRKVDIAKLPGGGPSKWKQLKKERPIKKSRPWLGKVRWREFVVPMQSKQNKSSYSKL